MTSITTARPSSKDGSNPDGDAAKPKRVRTGCLTCRERHLKCDEGMPNCQNCRKSSRTCRRGIRLNFMYIECKEPPVCLRSETNWTVRFEDNSREISDEYVGGLERYRPYDEAAPTMTAKSSTNGADAGLTTAARPMHDRTHSLSSQPPLVEPLTHMPGTAYGGIPLPRRQSHHHHNSSQSDSGYGSSNLAMFSTSSYALSDTPPTPIKETRKLVTSPYEALFMQVYVEEVAVWMDSLDPEKHVSHFIQCELLAHLASFHGSFHSRPSRPMTICCATR